MKRIIVTLTSALILISSLWGQEKVNEEPLTYSPIIKNGKQGFVDATVKIVIEPKFEKVGEFSEGLAVVVIDKKVGYIDTTGKIVIEPQFEQARNFKEDLAVVRIDKKEGFINKSGQVEIKPEFEKARNFSCGLAAVKINGDLLTGPANIWLHQNLTKLAISLAEWQESC